MHEPNSRAAHSGTAQRRGRGRATSEGSGANMCKKEVRSMKGSGWGRARGACPCGGLHAVGPASWRASGARRGWLRLVAHGRHRGVRLERGRVEQGGARPKRCQRWTGPEGKRTGSGAPVEPRAGVATALDAQHHRRTGRAGRRARVEPPRKAPRHAEWEPVFVVARRRVQGERGLDGTHGLARGRRACEPASHRALEQGVGPQQRLQLRLERADGAHFVEPGRVEASSVHDRVEVGPDRPTDHLAHAVDERPTRVAAQHQRVRPQPLAGGVVVPPPGEDAPGVCGGRRLVARSAAVPEQE
mmetsp:Transcript_13179/g.43239  ORF Transcript_13179/g.43239 Transcript_13179/m.43239 type:complete len:301 (+) Transcript_13179:525-1427(+)